MANYATLQHVLQAVAYRQVTPGLLDVFLRLFDGHDIPALYWAAGRRPGFFQSPLGRTRMFEAHLLGAVLAGSYPFRGVFLNCGCEDRAHTCDGRGCNYLCIDLDAHRGERDVEERTRRLLVTAWRVGLLPVVFSSRSGTGAHVYIFFTGAVTTRVAHAAGVALARAAGIHDRCDVIPSAEHGTGLGTLHALPMSPMAEPGGGTLYDSNLTPIGDERAAVSLLRWADANRSPVRVIRDLADGALVLPAAPQANPSPVLGATPTRRERATLDREAKSSEGDAALLEMIRGTHPQFRRALATPPEQWKGKRSSRDAYLVSYMRRQGMSNVGIVEAMCVLPDTKASERGPEYVWAILEAQAAAKPVALPLAGDKLGPAESKKMRAGLPWAPWAVRVPPPQTYDAQMNPWWRPDVQERLSAARGTDGIVLAHLVDSYYRGPFKRKMFYASTRGLGRRLGIPSRTIGDVVRRLAERFSDVLRVVPGVSHPVLRLANGFYVPERGHRDAMNWYVPPPGRLGLGTLCSPGRGSASPGHCGVEPVDTSAGDG